MKIEKGIPIPPIRPRGIAAILREMEVGDSVLLTNPYASAHSMARNVLGAGNYTARVENEGVRVWKTK